MEQGTTGARRPISELIALHGRVAVITGAARGIGRAIATRMAEAGTDLVLADLDAAAASTTAAALQAEFGIRALGLAADVTERSALEAIGDQAVATFGRLDIWVNNAGIYPQYDAVEVDPADFSRVLEINVAGVQNGISAAVPRMGRGGVVINLASTAAYRGAGAYSASKWAVRGLTQGAAQALGKRGIRIVALAPSLTLTPGMDELLQGDDNRKLFDAVAARNPLGRVGEPDDIALAAVFLASDMAGYVTGSTLLVDGGSLTAF